MTPKVATSGLVRPRLARGLCIGGALALATPAVAQQAQNPSPMSDTTRPHPRVAESRAAGERVTLIGSLRCALCRCREVRRVARRGCRRRGASPGTTARVVKRDAHVVERRLRNTLLREARAAIGARSDTDTVRLGLEALVRQAAYQRLRALRGTEPRAADVRRRREEAGATKHSAA